MPSMMGFASLAGVVVNDSILLVDFLKHRACEGLSIPKVAKRASRERFRAVLLTSLTTIAGLLPLLSDKESAGAGAHSTRNQFGVWTSGSNFTGVTSGAGVVCYTE
jgi:multidrug efflux pump subunit AcrB